MTSGLPKLVNIVEKAVQKYHVNTSLTSVQWKEKNALHIVSYLVDNLRIVITAHYCLNGAWEETSIYSLWTVLYIPQYRSFWRCFKVCALSTYFLHRSLYIFHTSYQEQEICLFGNLKASQKHYPTPRPWQVATQRQSPSDAELAFPQIHEQSAMEFWKATETYKL
jgi:hypothetical protein